VYTLNFHTAKYNFHTAKYNFLPRLQPSWTELAPIVASRRLDERVQRIIQVLKGREEGVERPDVECFDTMRR